MYLQNLQALKQTIAGKPTLPEQLPILAFPPINAGPGPRSNISFLDFQNGTGVRYVIAGWYQAYEESDYPTYTYQGITADGKYQVLFRYSRLYSPQLDNYLEQQKLLKNDVYDNNNKARFDNYVSGSFAALKTEENFSPSIEELDQFVKSIKIGK